MISARTKKKISPFTLLIIALMVIGLAGCGKDEASSTSGGTSFFPTVNI